MPKIKGTHNAMKSGMIVAEEAFEAVTNENLTSDTKGMYIHDQECIMIYVLSINTCISIIIHLAMVVTVSIYCSFIPKNLFTIFCSINM